MSLELVFDASYTLAKYRSGPLGKTLDGFCDWLLERGYSRHAARLILSHVKHLDQYLAVNNVWDDRLSDNHIGAFFKAYPRVARNRGPLDTHVRRVRWSINRFVHYLKPLGCYDSLVQEPVFVIVMDDYLQWMQDCRHVAMGTLGVRRHAISVFLSSLGSDATPGGTMMKALNLNSPLATQIQQFIRLRQLCGRDYQSQGKLLEYFDRFLVQTQVKRPPITRQIIESYQKTLSRLTPRGQANRFCVVRQFCEYLTRHEPHTYIPEPMKTPPSYTARKPYIYSTEELHRLLNVALELPPTGALRPHTYQTLLGLLYSTGLRIGEAFALNLESLHTEKQCLYVAQGKFRKARWVALSGSTWIALQRYLDKRLVKAPNTSDAPLFLNERGRRLRHCTVCHTFHTLLNKCDIAYSKLAGPRIHDLRHTFAVHRLLAWYQDGGNINARLPMLTTYMGHVDLQSTQVYLQPTAELLGHVSDRFHNHYLRTIDSKGGQS